MSSLPRSGATNLPAMTDSRLEVFSSNDPAKLRRLADELYSRGFFNCYMSPQLFNLFVFILKGFDNEDLALKVWTALMNCNLFVKISKDDLAEKVVASQSQDGSAVQEPSQTQTQSIATATTSATDTPQQEAPSSPPAEESVYLKPGFASARNLCITLRYLLYEKAVDYYYDDDKHREKDFGEFKILEDEPDKSDDEIFKDAKETQGRKGGEQDDYDDDEDDYDEDDEDKGEEKKEKKEDADGDAMEVDSETVPEDISVVTDGPHGEVVMDIPLSKVIAKPEYPSVSANFSSTDEAIGKMVHPILSTSSAIESNLEKSNELKLIKNFNKVYHSFENDLPNIVKRRRLEKSDKQLGLDGDEDGSDDEGREIRNMSKLMSLGGAANLSLKNLLGRIEDHRDELSITDIELKNLIMDVRKNRSKWANYNRIGQEELYEACEKVVTELRGYTEHSTPFLNRVSKREAPNYYEIIKTPMDLNTVMRKLRTLQYNNKKQFVDDLALIWQNCLTYNTDPKHYLRVDALAMQKKTQSLLPLIPDITIRDRAEVEKEAEIAAQQEKAEEKEEEEKGAKSSRGVGAGAAMKAQKGRKGTENAEENTQTTGDKSVVETPKEVKTDGPADTSASDMKPPLSAREKSLEPGTDTPGLEENEETESNLDEVQAAQEEDGDVHFEDLEMSTWKTLTSNTRYKLCQARSRLFKGNQLHINEESIYRDTNQMQNFLSYLEDSENLVLHRNRRYFDENDDPYLIEYDVTGGVPAIKYGGVDLEKEETAILEQMLAEGENVDGLPESGLKIPAVGSNNLMVRNISLMQDIRKVCFRINLIRLMQTSQFMHKSQFSVPAAERIRFEDIDAMSKLPTRDRMDPKVAYKCLEKSVSAVLMSTGFESSTPACATVLTQLAANYFGNLAKSLKMHMESTSINKIPIRGDAPLSYKDIILMTLNENGIEKPDTIYSYYKEFVIKRNKKLGDLKEALEGFLKSLLRPGLQDLSEKQFKDNSDQFVTGEFSEELGEDFFGFRELGLDKEFGMLSSSVPLHLLHSKLSYQFSHLGDKTKKDKFEDFKEFHFPKLAKKDLPKQVGVLQHYYEGLAERTETMYAKRLKKHQQHVTNGTVDPADTFVEYKDLNELPIIEDNDLPLKQRNSRPKVPPNGKITQIKKKVIANSFFIDDQDAWEKKEKEKSVAVPPVAPAAEAPPSTVVQ